MKDSKLNQLQGLRLKECRTEKQLTQQELSDLSHFSKQHISYIECGKRGMSYEAAAIFAQLLDVKKEYLLGEIDLKSDAAILKYKIDYDLNVLDSLNKLFVSLGYYLEAEAEYKNLQTGEVFTVNSEQDLPVPMESCYTNNIEFRDIGDNIVYEIDEKMYSQSKEEFEESCQPLYKRISESYILHDFAKEKTVKLTKKQRDALIDDITCFIDFRLSRL